MKNTQKGFMTAGAIVLGVLILGTGAYYYSRMSTPAEEISNREVKNETGVSTISGGEVSEKGITVTSPTLNEMVKLPIAVSGSINGNGWFGNEGEIGTVEVFDAHGKSISNKEILKTTTDWLVLPTQFSGVVGDREMMAYLQTDTGIIRITSRGAKNGDVIQTLEIPVRFR